MNFGEFSEHGILHTDVGAAARNAIKKRTKDNIDEAFGKIHNKLAASSKDDFEYNPFEYERVAFNSKRDRDIFVTYMQNNGYKVGEQLAFLDHAVNGQWLAEIPKEIEEEELDPSGRLTGYNGDENGGTAFSAASVLKEFEEETNINCYEQTKPSMEDTEIKNPNHNVGAKLRQSLTGEMGTVGVAAELIWSVSKETAAYLKNRTKQVEKIKNMYGITSDKTFLETGKQTASKMKSAVIIRDDSMVDGYHVLVDGMEVKAGTARNNLISRHIQRAADARAYAEKAEKKINKAETKTEKRQEKSDAWNDKLHQKKNPAKNALHETYAMDFKNEKAQLELETLLLARGADSTAYKAKTDKAGNETRRVYTDAEGKKIVVNHYHKSAKKVEAKLKKPEQNAERIERAIYGGGTQEYAVTHGFETEQLKKKITLTEDQKKDLSQILKDNPDVFKAFKARNEEGEAILTALATTGVAELSLVDRSLLDRAVQKGISKDKIWQNEIRLSMRPDTKLAETFRVSEIEKYEANQFAFKVDEGLQGLKEIAADLSVDKVMANAQTQIKWNTKEMAAMSLFTVSTGAGYTEYEKAAIQKLSEGFSSAAKAGEDYIPLFSAKEKADLESALIKYRDNRKVNEIGGVKISDLLKKINISHSEREAISKIGGLERELGIDLSGGFTTEKMLEINEAFIKKAETQGMFFVNHGKVNTKLLSQLGAGELKTLGISAKTRDMLVDINTKGKITKGSKPSNNVGKSHSGSSITSKLTNLASKDEDVAESMRDINELKADYAKLRRGGSHIKNGATKIRNTAQKLKLKRQERNIGKAGFDANGVKIKKPKNITPKKAKKRQSQLDKKLTKGSAEANAKFLAKSGKKVNKAAKKGTKFGKKAGKTAAKAGKKAGKTAVKAASTAKSAGGIAMGAATMNPVQIAYEGVKLAAQHWKLIVLKWIAAFCGIITALLAGLIVIVAILMCISAFLDAINPFNILSKLAAPKTYQDTAAYRIYDDHLKPKEKVWLRDSIYDFDKFFDERSASKYGSDYVYFPDYIKSFDNLVAYDHDGNGFYSDIYINPFWQTNTISTDKMNYKYKDGSSGYSYKPKDGTFNSEILTYSAAIEGDYSGSKSVTIGANNNAFQKLKYAPDGKTEYGYLSVESGHTSNLKDILCMTDVLYGMDLSDDSCTNGDKDSGMEGLLGKSPAQINIENAEAKVKGFFKWLWAAVKSVFTSEDFPKLKDFCSGKVGYGTVVNYCEHVFEGSHQEEMALSVEYHNVKDSIKFSTTAGDTYEITNDEIGQSQASLLGICLNPKITRFYLMWNTGDGHGDRISPFFYQYNGKSGAKYPVDVAGRYDVQITMANRTNKDTWQGGKINNDNYRKSAEDGSGGMLESLDGGLIDHDDCLITDMGSNEATYNWIKDYVDNHSYYHNPHSFDPAGTEGCWKTTKDEEVIAEKYVGGVSGGNYTLSGTQGDAYYTWNTSVTPNAPKSHTADDGWFDSEADARAAAAAYLQQEYNNTIIPSTVYSLNGDRTLFDYKHAETEPFDMVDVEIETREVGDGNWDYGQWYWKGGGFGGSFTTDSSGNWSAYYAIVMNGYGDSDTSGYTHACGGGAGTWDLRDIGTSSSGSGSMASIIAQEKAMGHIKAIYYADYYTYHYSDGTDWFIEKDNEDDPDEETGWGVRFKRCDGSYTDPCKFSSRTAYDDAQRIIVPICYRKETKKTQYRVKYARAKVYTQYWTQYTRDCKGHNFQYCGGHIACHSHGVVFSISNEQIDMAEVNDYTNGIPKVKDFPLGERGYDEVVGKVDTDKVEYTFPEAAKTGGCKSPLYDVQGSVTGMIGLNVYVDDNQWLDDYDTRSSDSFHLMKDIFDIDCNILKGDNIFPTQGCDIKQYEGWNADNMQLAILKYCSDWHEEYGFDIPQEICYNPYAIDRTTHKDVDLFDLVADADPEKTFKNIEGGYECGQDPLSEEDIEKICAELKTSYGAKFTKTREEAVRLSLGYVGRGHYNPNHHHDFLADECKSLTIEVRNVNGDSGMVGEGYLNYSGNCTAGDETSFTNFVRRYFGKDPFKENTATYRNPTKYSYTKSTGVCNALPADTVFHYSSSSYLDVTIPDAILASIETGNIFKAMSFDKSTKAGRKNWQHFLRTIIDEKEYRTAEFIGVIKNEVQLSTGQIIEPNTPIIVDLSSGHSSGIEGLGNIYLHGMPKTEFIENKSFCTPWWLTDATSKTYFVSFE